MRAPFSLPAECLEEIFSNLFEISSSDTRTYKSIKDLHSCTLVSRDWCKTSTRFLYEYPFHHFRRSSYNNFFKLIRTLLSCIPKSEIEQIIISSSSPLSNFENLLLNYNNNNNNNSSNIKPTFNYINFICGLNLNDILSEILSKESLFNYRNIWLSPYILNVNNIKEDQFSTLSIPIIRHLFKFLCNYCNNLKILNFTIQDNEYFNDIIETLLTLEDSEGKNKLSNLKELYYVNNNNSTSKDFYSTLSKSVCNLDLLYNEGNSFASSLPKFISSQKKLKHIILSEDINDPMFYMNIDRNHYDNDILFNSLITQNESLQTLEFKRFSFTRISENENSLKSLKNIKNLKLHKCKGIDDNLIPFAEGLTKLEVFEFVNGCYSILPEDFLIQIFKSSSNTLNRLIINYERKGNQRIQLFKEISIHLKSLTYLELPKIYSDELISIFKSCTELIYFSTILSDDGSWGSNFKILGKFIPKNLRKIQFKEINNFVFSSKALKYFFEGCKHSGGKIKYLEMKGEFVFNHHYLNAAKDFGVKLKVARRKHVKTSIINI